MVEQVTFNHWVTGSNPVPLTIFRGHCDWQVICSLAWFHALFLVSVAGQVTFSPVAKKSSDFDILKHSQYAHRLRGFTAHADGSRGGQPLTAVPYSEANNRQGEEIEEMLTTHDICDIAGHGVNLVFNCPM